MTPNLASFWEFPAFAGLGVGAGITAIGFMKAIELARRFAKDTPVPVWLKPAGAGLMVGLIGLLFPQVMGVGYGVTGVLFCDFVIASTTATFSFPEVTLGVPTIVGAIRLPERVRWADAMELLLTGKPVSAERAKEMGLVWRLVEPEDLQDTARAWARTLTEAAPLAQSSDQVEVTITSTGDYLVNGEKLAASDSKTLRTALLKLGQEKTDLPLQIYADANVAYQSVVRVYDVAGQLGFVKLSLTTRESPNEAQ